jgi:hypothetical protein
MLSIQVNSAHDDLQWPGWAPASLARAIAATGSDQCGEVGIFRVAARLAPDMHRQDVRDRARRRQLVAFQSGPPTSAARDPALLVSEEATM